MKRRVQVRDGKTFNRTEGGTLRAYAAGAVLSVSQHVFEKFRHVFAALDDGPEPAERRARPPVPGTDDELDALARAGRPSPIILPDPPHRSTAIAAHGGPRAAPPSPAAGAEKALELVPPAAVVGAGEVAGSCLGCSAPPGAPHAFGCGASEAAADRLEDVAAMVDRVADGGSAVEGGASSEQPKRRGRRPRASKP